MHTRENIEKTVSELLVKHLNLGNRMLKLSDSLIDDLNADSLDSVEVLIALEIEFKIKISDNDAQCINTVEDIVKYIQTRMSPATALQKSIPVKVKTDKDILVEARYDLKTHRAAWRKALEVMLVMSKTTGNDSNISYYEHELKVFDRTFDALLKANEKTVTG